MKNILLLKNNYAKSKNLFDSKLKNNNGFFMVTIYNASYDAQKVHSKFIDNFIENEKKVYKVILSNNYATTNDISNATGLANRTVAKYYKEAKRTKCDN